MGCITEEESGFLLADLWLRRVPMLQKKSALYNFHTLGKVGGITEEESGFLLADLWLECAPMLPRNLFFLAILGFGAVWGGITKEESGFRLR